MNLKSIATYLEDQGLGTQGTDLFINYMPPDAATGILLREPMGGSQIDWDLPGFIKTSFQLVVRTQVYQDGVDQINAVTTALHTGLKGGTVVAETQWNYARPRHEPFASAPTPGRATEFLVNMDVCYVDGGYAAV
jgi:hypothetical protein